MLWTKRNKTESKSKSGLFLMELIISICFFAVAGAVCIQLFVKAHYLSHDSVSVTNSVEICRNLMEIYDAVHGDNEAFEAVLRSDEGFSFAKNNASYIFYYNEGWNAAGAENAKYTVTFTCDNDIENRVGGRVKRIHMVCKGSGEPFYTLDSAIYVPATPIGIDLSSTAVKEGDYE